MKQLLAAVALFAGLLYFDVQPAGAAEQSKSSSDPSTASKPAEYAKATRDDSGRIKSIRYNKDNSTYSFTYRPDGKSLARVVVSNEKTGTVTDYRYSGNGDEWQVFDGNGWLRGIWHGDLRVASDGTYSQRAGRNGTTAPDQFWQSFKLDGTVLKQWFADNGTVSTYDSKERLTKAERPDGVTLTCEYAADGKALKITQGKDSKLKTWAKQADNRWTCDSKEHPEFRQNLGFRWTGELTYLTTDGIKWIEKSDGKKRLSKPDGSIVLVDANGLVYKVYNLSGDYRTYEYSAGKLSKCTTVTAEGKWVWDASKDNNQRRNLAVSATGEINYELADGSQVLETTNFASLKKNKAGELIEVVFPNGSKRSFEYNGKALAAVVDSNAAGNQSATWTTSDDKSAAARFVLRKNGKESKVEAVTVNAVGDVTYTTAAGKKAVSKAAWMIHSQIYADDELQDARAELLTLMAKHLSNEHLVRFERNMYGFESRMADLAYAKTVSGVAKETAHTHARKTVLGTYKELYLLVAEPEKTDKNETFFKQTMRATLAETFMFHAADPSTCNQGNNLTCWIQAGHIAGGMVSRANHMARLVKEVALTGQYTTLSSGLYGEPRKVVTFSKGLFNGLTKGPEANWNMDLARQSGNARSPVGFLFDQTLPVIGGRGEGDVSYGYYWGSNGSRNIMYMVTGTIVDDENNFADGSYKYSLLRNGGYVTYAPNHMRSRQIYRDGEQWIVIQDDQNGDERDYIIERINDLRTWLSGT